MVQMDILNSHNCCHQNNENIWKMCLWPISAGGAYSALPNPLAGFRESLRGRGGREGKGRRVEREGNRKEEKGRGQKGRKGKEGKVCVFCAKRYGAVIIECSACIGWEHRHVGSLHMETGVSRGGLVANYNAFRLCSYTYGLACHRHVPLQSNVVISHTDKFYRM